MKSAIKIGWKEQVSLPEWGITGIEAKADTGARSSAVDVKSLEFIDEEFVRFEVALSRKDRNHTVPVTARLKRRSKVKSSSGHVTERVVVETEILLGTVLKTIDISLICRKRMLHRMLIGRTALQGHFLVDSSQAYLVSSPPERKKRSPDSLPAAEHGELPLLPRPERKTKGKRKKSPG
ncbi:MAG: RimK/LysX family protein [Planctomycetaceae bacterium]|nr:ATP-dependent zinc protease [Planctomycetaceae bacterium]